MLNTCKYQYSGVKKITCKISIRTSRYFHAMSDGQVKNTAQGNLYFLKCPMLFGNRTSKKFTGRCTWLEDK